MGCGHQATETGRRRRGKMSLAKRSGRIHDTEVPYKQKRLRGSCRVPAALVCSSAFLIGGGRARENISAVVSA